MRIAVVPVGVPMKAVRAGRGDDGNIVRIAPDGAVHIGGTDGELGDLPDSEAVRLEIQIVGADGILHVDAIDGDVRIAGAQTVNGCAGAVAGGARLGNQNRGDLAVENRQALQLFR